MKILNLLFAGILFFLLSPSILLRLPKNGNKYTVAAVHALVFTLVLYLSNLFFHRFIKEGFLDDKCTNGTNQDGGPFQLEDESDPTSCKPLKN